MYCMSCGAKNNDGVRFCKQCGKPITESHAAGGEISTNVETASIPTASVNPAQAAAVQNSTPVTSPNTNSSTGYSRAERPAFVLGICAAALTFLPLPILSFFTLPCALIGFIFAFQMWHKAKCEDTMISNRGLAAIVLSGFALVANLVSRIPVSGSADALASALDILNGIMSF